MKKPLASAKRLAIAVAGLALLVGTATGGSPDASSSAPASGQVIDRWHWLPLWARQADAVKSAIDDKVRHDGGPSLRIEHTGREDWSLSPDTCGDNQPARLAVKEDDLLEVRAWVKLQGKGDAAVSVVTYDAAGKVVQWLYGARFTQESKEWTLLKARMVIPAGVTSVVPRLTGDGPATVWMEGFTLKRLGNVADLRGKAPRTVTLENPVLRASIDTRDATLDVTDLRTGKQWSQRATGHDLVVVAAKAIDKLSAEWRCLMSRWVWRSRSRSRWTRHPRSWPLHLPPKVSCPDRCSFQAPFAGRKGRT